MKKYSFLVLFLVLTIITGCSTKQIVPLVPISATIINGQIFTNENGYKGSGPVVLKDESDCFYTGYSVNIEKVFIQLEKASCSKEENIFEKQIKGYVYQNNYAGVSAEVDYSKDFIVATLKPSTKVTIFISNIY